MKILITGSKGMLAKEVIRRFHGNEIIAVDIEDLDITNEKIVFDFISNLKPEYIINCAAYTAVDKAEENYEVCNNVNNIGVKNLALAAKEVDATILHISTDYVFDGDKNLLEVYDETDVTNPKSVYGVTKRDGEVAIQESGCKYYILRTSWMFGDGNNFVMTMLNLGKDKDELNVVNDQFGSPTYSVDLADIIFKVIEKKVPFGIYHSTSTDYTNWYEFAKNIFELENINCRVNPVSTEQFPRPAKRPKNSKLSKDKLIKEGIVPPTYLDALKRYLGTIK